MADIRTNKWEWFHYDNPDFQVQYRINDIPANAIFPNMSIHWHDDVEFIYVLEGSVFYEMENETVKIHQGEGIFVNARQLHLIHADSCNSKLCCLIFHPIILCSTEYVTSNMVMPVLENESIPYILLSDKELWQKQLLQDIWQMGTCAMGTGGQLQTMKYIMDIWDLIYQNTSVEQDEPGNQSLSAVKKMISFIQHNYREKIMLTDICEAGNVGKTKCSALFDAYYNMTPMDYLRKYRIEKGAKLLEISDMSVTEIAYEVGFSDSSYFTKTFGQQIGCSPQEYRSYGRGMSRYYEVHRNWNL